MLTQDFCTILEIKIEKAFANSSNETIKYFSCDGVLLPNFENEYSKKFVNDNKKIILTAFVGATGQNRYEVTMNLGRKALSRYARDLDIAEFIPNDEKRDWFFVDTETRKIAIQLD